MKAFFLIAAATVALAIVGLRVPAQEIVPTPDPVGGSKTDAGVPVPPGPAASATAGAAKDNWRYRWYGGRWWYWTPQNRWLWYNDAGQWAEFSPKQAPPAVAQERYSPAPGYWTGYYPGVGVGVAPYGNVSVGVGRRIGVDVSGPHGSVRVGRICVGW
jgi:hypothetical protein